MFWLGLGAGRFFSAGYLVIRYVFLFLILMVDCGMDVVFFGDVFSFKNIERRCLSLSRFSF